MSNREQRLVTFGMIVLNGEPFVCYNLRALYPFAHQIIVVEGAVPAAAAIATPDGHSTDTTLETIRRFQAEEDPEHKVILVTAEDEGRPNGFWPKEKDEQSQAYARRATGDYLWQVDVDEFYRAQDMQTVLAMLQDDQEITTVSFKMLTFWGNFDTLTDGWYLRRGAAYYHRLFKWRQGYAYVTHRPPTVHDAQGCDLRSLRWVKGDVLAQQNIFLYHYSLLFPKQVLEKCAYYRQAPWAQRKDAQYWVEENFMRLGNPYRVHNVYDYPSWLEHFRGAHPEQIIAMQQDIVTGRLNIEMRSTDDVERLLRSPFYVVGCSWLKIMDHWDRRWNGSWKACRYHLRRWVMLLFRVMRQGWRLAKELLGRQT